jgi:hypothetical protein
MGVCLADGLAGDNLLWAIRILYATFKLQISYAIL